jgi:DNA polymerase-3 subunit beta
MKFSVDKTTLLQSLQYVNKAIPTRTTLPILNCALFEIKDEQLLIKTTNLEAYISIKINVENIEKGNVAIPLNTLLDITMAMPEDFLHFDVSDIGKVNIKSTCGKYTIMGQSADDFPAEPVVEKGNSLVVPSNEFNSIIESTVYATSKDELKPVLQGVLINMTKEGLTAVATDGHRLVRLIKTELKAGSFEGSIVVPVKFLSLLKPFLNKDESLSLRISENHIMINIEGVRVSSRIIKDRYPDYENVIPKDNESELTINKNDLLGSVKRVSIFSNKSTKQIALSLDINKITISTEDPENITTGKESIDCLYSGKPMIIGYNSQYLGDVLKNQETDEIKVLFKSPLSAGIFLPKDQLVGEEKTTLLMPIRLND